MLGQVKSRSFDVTPKRTPRLSTSFLRQTKNFRSPALHLLSFSYNLTFVEKISHTGPRNFDKTIVSVEITDKQIKGRASKVFCLGYQAIVLCVKK